MADEPEPLRLSTGARHTLRLPGLGTAGYVWTAGVAGGDGVVEVSVEPAPMDRRDVPVAGASSDELVTVAALRPGRVRVELVQGRHWEPPSKAVARRVLDIEVV